MVFTQTCFGLEGKLLLLRWFEVHVDFLAVVEHRSGYVVSGLG